VEGRHDIGMERNRRDRLIGKGHHLCGEERDMTGGQERDMTDRWKGDMTEG